LVDAQEDVRRDGFRIATSIALGFQPVKTTALASKADKAAGKVQNAVGGLKDAVRGK
jgi:hypothetical protein